MNGAAALYRAASAGGLGPSRAPRDARTARRTYLSLTGRAREPALRSSCAQRLQVFGHVRSLSPSGLSGLCRKRAIATPKPRDPALCTPGAQLARSLH